VKSTELVLLVVATVTTVACSRTPEATVQATAAPLPVVTARVALTDWPSTFETGGIVRAASTAPIASRVMAPVSAVYVRAGDHVRRGAPLVRLDAREMTANRDRAVAATAAAREASLAAEADAAAAEAGLALARATHRRIADLAGRQSATPQELDQAVAALSAAEAQFRAATARRAAAVAGLAAARAAGSAAETSVTYTELDAPFDAVVAERAIDPGAMATPGLPLLVLEDPASFRLEVRVDESRGAQVQVGERVECAIGTDTGAVGPAAWITGRVSEIARLDPASHAFVVKIDLPANASARSGSYGRARFTGPSRQTLTVPSTALLRRGQLAFVFTVDSVNVARLRFVAPGEVAGGQVEALAGLTDGDVVIAPLPPALTDGRPVVPAGAGR
jgi:RND family efflux transporter MFP subunit